MSSDQMRPAGNVERIDADAVCMECGSVNPEGTLLCKTCGNNLRDQRAKRFAEGVAGEPGTLPSEKPRWLTKGLAVLGILIILWTAINLGNIEDMLTEAQTHDFLDVDAYWGGAAGAVYDAMEQQLQDEPVTRASIDLALQVVNTTQPPLEGRYVLLREGFGARRLPVGEAIVEQEDASTIRFVALLNNGRVQMRGTAVFEADANIAARNSACVQIAGEYYGVNGFASILEEGGYACLGYRDEDEATYSALAFRIPEAGEVPASIIEPTEETLPSDDTLDELSGSSTLTTPIDETESSEF